MKPHRSRSFRILAAVAAAVIVAAAAVPADARAGRGGSAGSRGSRTYEAPPPTRTAPQAAPMDRASPQTPQPGVNRTAPRPAAATPATGGFFSRGGFGGMLMGGLIGAGIAGMLFGGGFFDGLGSLAGVLGFLLQIALIGGLVFLVVSLFRGGRTRPAYAGGSPNGPQPYARTGLQGGGGGGGGGGRTAPRAPGDDQVGIGPDDYAAFERLLAGVQEAYGREDAAALARLATPDLVAHLQDELAANAAQGVVNTVSDPRLLQGDLAEAWREGSTDFATVAMRFSVIDVTLDRATGRRVEGDPERPVEATELWTMRRDRGGPWVVSAIQQG